MSEVDQQNPGIGRVFLGAALVLLASTLMFYGIVTIMQSDPPNEAILSPFPPYDPYDSLRTDLSDYMWPTD
ncbi:MAG: hypothetical protein KAJ12_12005, partial [Bacteroidetes bacterium]|nr:hypothetical protein [Bacteroidota bacterium]